MDNKVKILIVSNEFCSGSSSNGRTLMNMLKGFPKENLAQFALHGEIDENFCNNVYRVSDKDALNAFLGKKKKSTNNEGSVSTTNTDDKKIAKSCRNRVFRDIIWKSYRWWKKDFDKFVKDFAPSVILFQAGDAPFMFAIARKLAKKLAVPLVMYNSENYVLKEKMYSRAKKDFWHAVLKNSLKKEYKKLMKTVSFCIYSTEYLEDCYQKAYPHPDKSATLYTVTDMQDCSSKEDSLHFTLLYCGNLGVGRVEPLSEIAKVLAKVDANAKLYVYGKFPDEDSQKIVCDNANVVYGGVVPYDQVPQKIKESSMVIHTENPNRLQNLLGAFSTKIADCLACGKPFLVYALRDYPFVQYLEKNNAAHIAESVEELEKVLKQCINSLEYRNKFLSNAKMLAKRNHNMEENCKKISSIIKKIVRE